MRFTMVPFLAVAPPCRSEVVPSWLAVLSLCSSCSTLWMMHSRDLSTFSHTFSWRDSRGQWRVAVLASRRGGEPALTHPLLLVPVMLQRAAAAAPAPRGQQRVLVVAEDHLLRVGRGRRLGGYVVGPGGAQRLHGRGQQLAVAHRHQLAGLWGQGSEVHKGMQPHKHRVSGPTLGLSTRVTCVPILKNP